MSKKRIIFTTVGLVFLAGLTWVWLARQNEFRDRAYYVPTTPTINIMASEVSVTCKRDSDCELVRLNYDYRKCDAFIGCIPAGPSTRAVNRDAWQRLYNQEHFMTPEQCDPHPSPAGSTLKLDACTGGIVADAKCYHGRCTAYQVLP